MSAARRTHAFTLVEVLAALAIFATAVVALGFGYVNVLNGYEVARRATVSNPEAQFARAQLLNQPDVELARRGGEFDTADGRHLKWTATIDPTDLADVFTVTFEYEISGTSAVREQKSREVFRVLRPTWSDEKDRNTLRAATRDRIKKLLDAVNK